jgi:hypothetical protein
MGEITAHPGIQTAVRSRHVASTESVDGEGAKWTSRLVLENRHAAAHRAARVDGRRDRVIQKFRGRRGSVHPIRVTRNSVGTYCIVVALRQLDDEGAGA